MNSEAQFDDEAWAQRRRGAEDARHCKEISLHTAEILLGRRSEGKASPDLIQTLEDCAEINQLAENFLLRGSHEARIACNSASEICEACAEACERYPQDWVLSECAQVCRDTMESLRRIGPVGA
jgi:hypothetical protein